MEDKTAPATQTHDEEHDPENLMAEARLLNATESTTSRDEYWSALMVTMDLIRQSAFDMLTSGESPAAAFSELLYIGVRLAERTTPEWRRDTIWPDHEDGITVENDAVLAMANRLRVGAKMASDIHDTVHHPDGPVS
jgi:hypothetical protein